MADVNESTGTVNGESASPIEGSVAEVAQAPTSAVPVVDDSSDDEPTFRAEQVALLVDGKLSAAETNGNGENPMEEQTSILVDAIPSVPTHRTTSVPKPILRAPKIVSAQNKEKAIIKSWYTGNPKNSAKVKPTANSKSDALEVAEKAAGSLPTNGESIVDDPANGEPTDHSTTIANADSSPLPETLIDAVAKTPEASSAPPAVRPQSRSKLMAAKTYIKQSFDSTKSKRQLETDDSTSANKKSKAKAVKQVNKAGKAVNQTDKAVKQKDKPSKPAEQANVEKTVKKKADKTAASKKAAVGEDQSKGKETQEQSAGTQEVWSGEPTEPLEGGWPPGWTKKIYERGSGKTKGTKDRYWFTPIEKRKLRSMAEVKRFLEALAKTNGDESAAWDMFKSK